MPLQAMIQVLQEQKNAHNQLLEIAAQKKDALVGNHVDLLNQLVHKEARLVKQISELEDKRQFEMNRFIVSKGYRIDPNLTVSDMLKLVFKAEDKLTLQNLQSELLEIIDKLKEANAINQQLIEQSLQFIDYSLDLLTGSDDGDAVYQHPAQVQSSSSTRRGVFDTKA
jgi:flagellar biosynthesis/type III secretory pathway chaperone